MATSTKDPFSWGVEDVVKAICRTSPWTSNPAVLESKVRDEEIDGRLLLTSESTLSKDELMQCLAITKFRHKAALAEELIKLRSESSLYKKWKREFTKRQQMEDEDELGDIQMTDGIEAPANDQDVPSLPQGDIVSNQASVPPSMGQTPKDSLQDAHLPDTQELEAVAARFHESPLQSQPEESIAAPKRRRLAPTNTSHKPYTQRIEHEYPWEHNKPGCYLGEGKIAVEAIKSSAIQISTRVEDLGPDGDFAVKAPNHLPPGRRLAVSRVMNHMLQKNGRREAMAREGLDAESSDASSAGGEEIVDLADLSDWDEQTLREMQEEEDDIARARLEDRYLSPENVEAIIEDAIEEMRQNWELVKLPKYERKAYNIWKAATRRGDKVQQIIRARQQVSNYEIRIRQLIERIKSERWKDESKVRFQAQSLEQSLDDKFHRSWLIKTLELRQPPPKPSVLPALPAKREKERGEDPLDEILTSSEEEEEDDFIVPDEIPIAPTTPPKASQNPVTPVKSRPAAIVDLTQSTATMRNRFRDVIDLTTPTKTIIKTDVETPEPQETPSVVVGDLHDLEEQPSLEDLDVEAIGKASGKTWAQQNDRWRLAICIIRNLTHERRTAVLTRIETNVDDELWHLCIEGYLKSPLSSMDDLDDMEAGTENFDMLRAFLCFATCRSFKEQRLKPLKDKYIKQLRQHKQLFSPFCEFLRNIADKFPQDSQMLNTQLFLDATQDIDMEGSGEDDEEMLRSVVGKQVVQNRDAVNLREREKQRGIEQEARRARLRAALVSTGRAGQDQTRLIINESKEEGQSLIYVNDEIGKQIKTHQVEGVRFLWNQIVQPKDVRQGCLLAHTMGLGKTMQVITFLVALTEASTSLDPATRDQIPEDLRTSHTLILCPSGLVENWMDEILKWAPKGLLGILRQLDASTTNMMDRKETVMNWARDGGVLITGYQMFQRVLAIDDEVKSTLLEKAVVVVADEAHKLKNPKAAVSQACSQLTTNCRIALTGSPLANNVEEYYAMISWVAPNFLGPIDEFRRIYANDIQKGFYKDSTHSERRRALITLRVLTATVAPKINRATVQSAHVVDLPAKSEYIIYLSPTTLQTQLYNMYISALGGGSDDDMAQSMVFSTCHDLGLICAHPSCFAHKLRKPDPDLNPSFPRSVIKPGIEIIKKSGIDARDSSVSLKTAFLMIVLEEAKKVNDKVLVFSSSLTTLDYLEALLSIQKRRVCRLDGGTKIKDRQELTRKINRDNIEVGLISTTAGGVGLNIQGANRVVIFDFRWNPVDTQQAVGRAYRIGQKKKVFVYHFLQAGTFEESIHDRAVFKSQLAARVVDAKNVKSVVNKQPPLIHPVKPQKLNDIACYMGRDPILDKLIEFRDDARPGEQLIGKIVPTDTFEEEDHLNKLTEGEKQQADQMIQQQKLKGTTGFAPIPLPISPSVAMVSAPPSTAPPGPVPVQPNSHSQPPSSSNPWAAPAPVGSVSRSMDGVDDGHGFRGQQTPWRIDMDQIRQSHQSMPQHYHNHHHRPGSGVADRPQQQSFQHPQTPAPVGPPPPPVAGANTHFGTPKPAGSVPSQPPQHRVIGVAKSQPTPPAPAFGGLGHGAVPEKIVFSRRLGDAVRRLQHRGVLDRNYSAEHFTEHVVQAIDTVRQQNQYGFLPDNAHWKQLNAKLDDNRFVMSTLSGHLGANFLALAADNELQRRMNTINELSDQEFQEQMDRRMRPQLHATQGGSRGSNGAATSPGNPGAPGIQPNPNSNREADDPKRRFKELPRWAQEEVNRGRPR